MNNWDDEAEAMKTKSKLKQMKEQKILLDTLSTLREEHNRKKKAVGARGDGQK